MAIKSNKAIKISQTHLLGIQDLSINDVNIILDEASKFIELNAIVSVDQLHENTYQKKKDEQKDFEELTMAIAKKNGLVSID